jgi:pyrroline-5-carboxylate reductase
VVIGAGKMGGALVDGWLEARALIRTTLRLVDPALETDDRGWPAKGVACFASLRRGAECRRAQPGAPGDQAANDAHNVLPGLAGLDHAGLTVLSIAAGTTLATLQDAFPNAVAFVPCPTHPRRSARVSRPVYGPGASRTVQEGVTALLEAVGRLSGWTMSEQWMR